MPQQERNPKQAAISLAAPLEQIEKNLTAEEQFKKMESAAPVPALNLGQLGALASAAVTPLYQGKTSSTLPVPTMAPLGTGTGGFKATVPPSPAHKGSTAFLGAGSHQEMVLPLSEAAPELFGGNPAAATPHYDAIGAAPPSASSAIPYLVPRPQLPNAAGATPLGGYSAATPQLTAGQPWAQPNVTFGAPTANAGGFKSTVPPSPAHAASTTFLGAGGHQEMVLPLSEAAPELFGGNPAAATPHYDAVGAAGTAPAAAASFPMMGASAPAAPFMGNAAGMPIVTPAYSTTPGGARSALPPFAPSPAGFTPRGAAAAGVSGFKATVPPSPAHQASTAYLSSGSHQEMVLPLSEAAPELFGGNPAAATPHYDAVGAATGAYAGASGYAGFNAPAMTAGPAPIPFAPGISTITPMAPVTRNLPFGGAANFAPSPAIRGGGGAATPSGFKATVPSSPAHQASTAYLSSGSHQEMFLPLSEAAPELFGGNPAASTPHYDAIGAATGDANFAPPARLPAGPAPIPLAPGISTVTPMARNPAGAASARIPEWNGS